MSSRPTPCAPARAVELLDGLQHGDRLAVERDRNARPRSVMTTSSGSPRLGRVRRCRSRRPRWARSRCPPGSRSPRRGPRRSGRSSTASFFVTSIGRCAVLGPGDGLLPGPGEVADRGDHFRSGASGLDADLEPHLVVALAGAAVRHRGGAVVLGGLHQVLDDQRAGTAPRPAGSGPCRARWPAAPAGSTPRRTRRARRRPRPRPRRRPAPACGSPRGPRRPGRRRRRRRPPRRRSPRRSSRSPTEVSSPPE